MAINNLTDLRRELCEAIERVKKERAYVVQAVEITNAAGKIINSLRLEMDYYKLSKIPPPPSQFLLGDTASGRRESK